MLFSGKKKDRPQKGTKDTKKIVKDSAGIYLLYDLVREISFSMYQYLRALRVEYVCCYKIGAIKLAVEKYALSNCSWFCAFCVF